MTDFTKGELVSMKTQLRKIPYSFNARVFAIAMRYEPTMWCECDDAPDFKKNRVFYFHRFDVKIPTLLYRNPFYCAYKSFESSASFPYIINKMASSRHDSIWALSKEDAEIVISTMNKILEHKYFHNETSEAP